MLNDCVLIVEDEYLIADQLGSMIEDLGLRVCDYAASADRAVELARKHMPKLILMDVRLRGEKDGIDAALTIHPEVGSSIVYITGSREPSTVARIQRDHPSAILFKPITLAQLRDAVHDAANED